MILVAFWSLKHMRKLFTPLVALTAAMFAYAPIVIANAPFESTMGLVQKIFYFHVPSWMAMFTAVVRLRRRERDLSVQEATRRPTGCAVVGRRARPSCSALIGLVSGPLWGRKAWGVWWQWDARLTMALCSS